MSSTACGPPASANGCSQRRQPPPAAGPAIFFAPGIAQTSQSCYAVTRISGGFSAGPEAGADKTLKKVAGNILAALGWYAAFMAMQAAVGLAGSLLLLAHAVLAGSLANWSEAAIYDQYSSAFLQAVLPLTLLSYALLVATLLIAFWGCGKSLWRECRFVRAPKRCYLWPVLTALFLYLAANVSLLVAPYPEAMLEPLEDYSAELSGGGMVLFTLCVVCITPLVEELVFRGLIYRQLRRAMPAGAAILLSALIFGSAHLGGSWLLMIPAFVVGLTNAYTLEKTGSLLPCIAAHFAANLSSLLQALFLFTGSGVQWAAAILSLTASAVCAVLLLASRAGTKTGYF